MPCSITIQDIRGVVPVGQTEITTLRVIGYAFGCTQVSVGSTALGIAATPVPVVNDQFYADLSITVAPKPSCGDSVDVLVTCSDGISHCQQSGNFQLVCCALTIRTVVGVTPGHALRPTSLEVDGIAAGCPTPSGATTPSVQVTATTATGAVIGTATVAVDNITRAFLASVPINQQVTPLLCGQKIGITVTCDSGMLCSTSDTFELGCPECYRVEATVDLSQPCTGPPGNQTKIVTLSSAIGLRPGITSEDFQWDLGPGIQGSRFTAKVASQSATFTHSEQFTLAPGTYTARLLFARGQPENCPEYQRSPSCAPRRRRRAALQPTSPSSRRNA